MAEAFVSLIVRRIGDLLIQQASFLVGVKDQVEDLRNELMWIQSFLEDADSRQDEGSVVQTWLSEIRDVAYDIEDIIDTYILKVVDEDENPTARRRGILGSLKKNACICIKGANLYTIGNEVEEVETRIQRIGEAMQKYGIHRKDGGGRGGDVRRPSPQQRFLQLRRSSPHDDGTLKDTIELGKQVEGLVAKLENEEVITITGMGGIGKTTLATKVYNCEKVKRHFERRAWAYVSKDFNVKDVFKRLVKEVMPTPTPNLSTEELQKLELLSEEDLEEKLRELLKDYTYLVVLDDIWDLEAWESLKRALPHNKSGRVILTSRNTRIAKESFIYQLWPLNETDSWKLFVVKAFWNDGCPTNLEASGKEMVKKCDGLPLAITVLAGLLRGKSPQQWFIVGDHINDLLMKEEGKNNVEKILSLSYNDLPHQLKPCFLHIGLFPEDFEINVVQLIQFWIAEGFIRCEGDYKTMEDVANDYLNELIDRNMLQSVRWETLGKVRYCRIHDLLRDICISKGQKEHFIDFSPRATSSSSSASTTATIYRSRRYAIHSGMERYDFFNLSSNSHLRTLQLFNLDGQSLQQRQLEFISNMRLLRVFDLLDVDLHGLTLPDAFGKLIHLRYLGLNNVKVPSSIESLRSLLTLRLWGDEYCRWNDIAIGALSKLTQLRHLQFHDEYWNGLDRVAALRLRFDTLTNLQSLDGVDALIWEENEMTNLINLRDLTIVNMQASSDVELVLSSVVKLDKIQLLSLRLALYHSENPMYALPTPLLLSNCRHLYNLNLMGNIERLPEDFYKVFPPRLTRLQLSYSRQGPEAMAILEKLPHLTFLRLGKDSIMGNKIVCFASGFPQLHQMIMVNLEIEEWEINEGALPKLKFLEIYNCSILKIPMGLRFVASLQEFKLSFMSKEFWDRMDRGEYAHEIRHIPSIETHR